MAYEFTFLDWLKLVPQVIAIPLMLIIYGRKLVQDHERRGKWNRIKVIIFTAFIIEIFSTTIDLLFVSGVLPADWYSAELQLSLNHAGTGIMVTLGLYFVSYLYNWRKLLYFSIYFMGGILIYFLLTGRDLLFTLFCYIGGVIGIFNLLIAGIRIKDPGPLGLGIFYVLSLLTIVVDAIDPLQGIGISVITTTIQYTFGLMLVTGRFNPYKKAKLGIPEIPVATEAP